jgi:hypothetical protein
MTSNFKRDQFEKEVLSWSREHGFLADREGPVLIIQSLSYQVCLFCWCRLPGGISKQEQADIYKWLDACTSMKGKGATGVVLTERRWRNVQRWLLEKREGSVA